MKWIKGPLSFPTSEDWRYWTPTTPEGGFLAWFFSTGLPGATDILIGEYTTLEEAQKACEEHAKNVEIAK
jgi:hypothetical protein